MINITQNEVHIWHIDDNEISSSELLQYFHSLLNTEELKRHDRFYFEKDRHQFLITRGIVRNILSLYADDIPPEKWLFSKNRYGKPYIGNLNLDRKMYFNISHTKNMITIAVSLIKEIGVDVEYIYRRNQTLKVANYAFSKLEYNQLKLLPPEKQEERFFNLWTLKESYIKACGMGLSIPLDKFSFHFFDENRIKISFDPSLQEKSEDWHFWQMQPNDTHKISLAAKVEGLQKRSIKVSNSAVNLKQINKYSEFYNIMHGLQLQH